MTSFCTAPLKSKISNLNYEIRTHFFGQKKFQVRKGILPGNSKSLCHAVKLAKNQGLELIPPNMNYHGIEVTGDDSAEVFAGFFDKKVVGIVESTRVDPGVYNGRQKIIATDEMFMTGDKILESIKGLKLKNTEGYDRIPQRIIIDGGMVLCRPLENLFRLIYRDKCVPGQWLISKIIPVHKKGDKKCVENYRPVANLCSVSKIFERLILQRILELEAISGIKVGGKQQHGFTKNRSTLTAGLLIQSLITRALEKNEYVALAAIDLSAAFDIVNVDLLIKRLVILGLPSDVIKLIEIWLVERYFYVSVNGSDSMV